MYLQLVEAENDLDGIMEYVRQNPGDIETYAGRLAERFKDEIMVLPRPAVFWLTLKTIDFIIKRILQYFTIQKLFNYSKLIFFVGREGE